MALFTDSDAFAGTERHILELARGLRKTGTDIFIACPSPSPLANLAQEDSIPIITIAKGGLIDIAAIRQLVGLLRTGQIQILHSHNGRTRLTAAIAVTLSRRGAAVATQHFLEPDHVSHRGWKAALFRWAHRWVTWRTSQFIAIGEAVRTSMLERHEAPPGKITVVPNGISDPSDAVLTPAAAVRQELGVTNGIPVVACAARLEPEKDVAGLISSIEIVQRTCPELVCWVAGDGSERTNLTSHLQQSGLETTVRLLGFRQDVLSLIRAADIFVLPAPAEPFGLVLLEAMALGKPVVAMRAGGPREIVIERETGFLVQPSDPQALAAAILSLIKNPARREDMGEKARQRFRSQYTVGQMAAATLAVYQKILEQTR